MRRQTGSRAYTGIDILSASLDWSAVIARAAEILWTRSLGPDTIAAARIRRFTELTRFARAHSSFYRTAWRTLPQRDLSLHELPIVTKRDLMMQFDDWVTDQTVTRDGVNEFAADKHRIGERFLDRFVVWKSSGSTGEPGIFIQDDSALSCYDALLTVQLRSTNAANPYLWTGLTQGGGAALVTAIDDHFASIASWRRACRAMPWSHAKAFSVMDPLDKLVGELNAYQPAFLASYPTTLALLAAEKTAGRLSIAPTYIWSGGEYLADGVRARIETAFGSRLINEYGASECLSIAYSCDAGTLHLNADWVILEAVDRDYRPVQPGEPSHTVLLTNLANRIQPIIRYDLGDSITLGVGRCACGSALPSLTVEGRHDDMLALRSSNGSRVRLSPLALTTVVEEVLACRRFQIVQTGPALIALRLDTRKPGERRGDWYAAKRALHAYLVQQALGNVDVILDSRLPFPDARSGKLREVVAHGDAPGPRLASSLVPSSPETIPNARNAGAH